MDDLFAEEDHRVSTNCSNKLSTKYPWNDIAIFTLFFILAQCRTFPIRTLYVFQFYTKMIANTIRE